MKDEPKEGYSKQSDSEELEAVITENPTATCRELAEQFNVVYIPVLRRMKMMEKVAVVEK